MCESHIIINASKNISFCKTQDEAPRETLPDYKDDLPGSYRVQRSNHE